jgi:hypothetical protein
MTREHRAKCDCCSPVARPLNDTLRSRAPLIPTIRPMKPTSKNAKEIIWRKRFGVRGLFAFSGTNKPGSALCARSESPGSRVGGSTTASPGYCVVQPALKTVSYFIQSVTTGFIAKSCPYRNRVSLNEAFEGPEPDDRQLLRPVLRGPGPSNGARLLGPFLKPQASEIAVGSGTEPTYKEPNADHWREA